jgi:hypothetical protein
MTKLSTMGKLSKLSNMSNLTKNNLDKIDNLDMFLIVDKVDAKETRRGCKTLKHGWRKPTSRKKGLIRARRKARDSATGR